VAPTAPQTLERIPKMSAHWYGEVIRKNRLDLV
jgi:beta-glucosidase/6-phospho-beta-glucosidase/beta-galactosidase